MSSGYIDAWRGNEVRQLAPDETERIAPLSQSLWCDVNDPETNVVGQIGHSFSANDENRQHFTQTRKVNIPTGNSYGQPTYQERQEVTEVVDFCGYHWAKQNPFLSRSPDAIEAAELESSQSEAEMWQAKYEAEVAKKRK